MKNLTKLTLLFSALILLTACPKKEQMQADHVNVYFIHSLDNLLIIKDSLLYTNEAGQLYSIKNLQYLISDIKLTDENGNILQELASEHFVSSDDESTYKLYLSEILHTGEYANIEFTLGLDSSSNISNLYLNESYHTQMFWPDMMGGGYHYMKLEGAFNNDSSFYNIHTGASMGNDYSITKSFPINLTSIENGKTHDITINMKINNWFSNPNTIILSNDGIMGNMQYQIELQQNGTEDVFDMIGGSQEIAFSINK